MPDDKEYVETTKMDLFGYTVPDGSDDYKKGFQDGVDFVLDRFYNIPREDVAPVIHSHWIHTGEYLTNSDGKRLKKLSDLYVCHRCHRVEVVPELYCNCGAKMDEEMEEDD